MIISCGYLMIISPEVFSLYLPHDPISYRYLYKAYQWEGFFITFKLRAEGVIYLLIYPAYGSDFLQSILFG